MGNITDEAYAIQHQKKDNLLPRCVLCDKVPEMGLNDGFLLSGQFICSKCEKIILSLDYDDPTYREVVEKLRKIMFNRKGSF